MVNGAELPQLAPVEVEPRALTAPELAEAVPAGPDAGTTTQRLTRLHQRLV